jgi:M6 family metalloprotease-like protein
MSSPPPTCSTTGVQHIAVILLTMPGATTFPAGFDSTYFQQLFFGGSGYSLNTYWQETSYGKTSATGQVFGPFALSQNYPCEQSDAIATAAIQAASSVDFTQFDRLALIFPVSTCSFGGLGTIGCWETIIPGQNISISWLPVFPYQQTSNYVGTVTHETGHNLGLNHSNTIDYGNVPVGAFDDAGSNVEYGDPFSVMGQVWTVDGNQKIFGQYNAQHKSEELGWLSLTSGEYQEVTSGGSFTMLPLEAYSGLRALRVLRDPAIGEWLWLEYRQPQGSVDSTFSFLPDIGEPTSIFGGALLHVEDPFLDPLHTYLADFSAIANPNDFYHAPLAPPNSWSDPYSPLTISINSADSNSISAMVNYDAPCAVLSTAGSPFPASGGSGSITVTAPASCSWTAKTSTSWISLTGAASGSGNGTVNFSAAASPGGLTQRNGFIAVQRQSLPIIEAGTGSLILGASPAFGTGRNAHITFSFSDPHGFADISSASLAMPGCSMLVLPGSTSLLLLNDAGTQYIPAFNLSASGTSVSNSQCTISSNGSGIVTSGNRLQVTLQMTFATSFVGSHGITAGLADGQGNYTPLPVATWMVPLTGSGAPAVSLSPTNLAFGNRAVGDPSLPLTVAVTNSGTALLNIASIAISGVNATDFSQTSNCSSTLAVSASCTVSITFTPAATGSRSAALVITDNAPGAPQSAPLTGSGGMIPDVALSPVDLIFPGQTVGTKSSPSTVTLSNQGSDVLNISQISVNGNNASDFSETHDCGTSLAAGASCSISVIFAPSGVGSRLAAISIADNASGSPHNIQLSGPAMDFALATTDASTSATVAAGQTATYHLDVSGQNGFSGSVTIACADSVPLSSCSASSTAPITVGSDPVPFTISVSTTASTSTAAGSLGGSSTLGFFLFATSLLLISLRLNSRRLVLSFALALLAFGLASCGGGGGVGSAPPTPHATPAGTYTVTVNATSSGITRPISLTLKVH